MAKEITCPLAGFGCEWAEWVEEGEPMMQRVRDHVRWEHVGPLDFGEATPTQAAFPLALAGVLTWKEAHAVCDRDFEKGWEQNVSIVLPWYPRKGGLIWISAVLWFGLGVAEGYIAGLGGFPLGLILVSVMLPLFGIASYVAHRRRWYPGKKKAPRDVGGP